MELLHHSAQCLLHIGMTLQPYGHIFCQFSEISRTHISIWSFCIYGVMGLPHNIAIMQTFGCWTTWC